MQEKLNIITIIIAIIIEILEPKTKFPLIFD